MRIFVIGLVASLFLQARDSVNAEIRYAPAPMPDVACDSSNPAFVCGMHNPEDLVHLVGSHWVVASSMNMNMTVPPTVRGTGPLTAINVDTHRVRALFPARGSLVAWDRKLFPNCSAPPHLFVSIGLNVRRLGPTDFRLYVASHGERESVEIIDIASSDEQITAKWRGCVLVPRKLNIWPNAVAPLPDNAFALSGQNVAVWQPVRGWKQLGDFRGFSLNKPAQPGEGFANGIAVSRDGKWLMVADTLRESVFRLSLDGTAPPVKLPITSLRPGHFWPDNLRYGDDGELYLAGSYRSTSDTLPFPCYRRPICDEIGIGIVRIDPERMTEEMVYKSDGMKGEFGVATTALRIGGHFWVGTGVGDRLAVLPAP